jgi:hypothetical protein
MCRYGTFWKSARKGLTVSQGLATNGNIWFRAKFRASEIGLNFDTSPFLHFYCGSTGILYSRRLLSRLSSSNTQHTTTNTRRRTRRTNHYTRLCSKSLQHPAHTLDSQAVHPRRVFLHRLSIMPWGASGSRAR